MDYLSVLFTRHHLAEPIKWRMSNIIKQAVLWRCWASNVIFRSCGVAGMTRMCSSQFHDILWQIPHLRGCFWSVRLLVEVTPYRAHTCVSGILTHFRHCMLSRAPWARFIRNDGPWHSYCSQLHVQDLRFLCPFLVLIETYLVLLRIYTPSRHAQKTTTIPIQDLPDWDPFMPKTNYYPCTSQSIYDSGHLLKLLNNKWTRTSARSWTMPCSHSHWNHIICTDKIWCSWVILGLLGMRE